MLNTARILIANGGDTSLLLITDSLRIEGYECNYVQDVATVTEILKCVKFDLLILDSNMLGNSALEIIRDLSDNAKEISIILVTDFPFSDSQTQSLKPSLTACLNKPLCFEELLKHVKCSIDDKVYN